MLGAEYTLLGSMVSMVIRAWKEGLGQEAFVKEKKERQMEEARLRVIEEQKAKAKENENDETLNHYKSRYIAISNN